MKLYDISLAVSADMPVWPGDPAVRMWRASSISGGDPCNVTRLDIGAHTGTHVDAPLHFIDGAAAVDRLSLESLVGPCLVADFSDCETITADALSRLPDPPGERILFKTRNSARREEYGAKFFEGFTAVDESAAGRIARWGVKLVGIDYLSVERYPSPPGNPVHVALLSAGIVILEGLDLSEVPAGSYELICLPVKLRGSDGAPARAVLRDMR